MEIIYEEEPQEIYDEIFINDIDEYIRYFKNDINTFRSEIRFQKGRLESEREYSSFNESYVLNRIDYFSTCVEMAKQVIKILDTQHKFLDDDSLYNLLLDFDSSTFEYVYKDELKGYESGARSDFYVIPYETREFIIQQFEKVGLNYFYDMSSYVKK